MNTSLKYTEFVFAILLLTFSAYAATDELYIIQGDLYHSNFNNIKALESYQKAYEVNPDNFEIIKKLIIASNDCGEDQVEVNEDKAKEYFRLSVKYTEKAKEKYPDEPDLFLLLSWC